MRRAYCQHADHDWEPNGGQDLMGVVSVSCNMLTGSYDAPMVRARPGLEKAMEAKHPIDTAFGLEPEIYENIFCP